MEEMRSGIRGFSVKGHRRTRKEVGAAGDQSRIWRLDGEEGENGRKRRKKDYATDTWVSHGR
jgi:hypothetical protein